MYETIGIHEKTTYAEPKTVIALEIIPQKTLDNILVKDIKLNDYAIIFVLNGACCQRGFL